MSKKAKQASVIQAYFAEARDYDKVVEAEASFFNGLASMRTEFAGNRSVDESVRKMANFIQDPKGNALEFTVEFDVEDPRKQVPHKLFLGTRLSPKVGTSNAEVTHYMCLADENSLMAKFHVDFDFDPHVKEKKPSPHIQLGGRIPPALLGRYSQHYWHTDVNKPRIPALPISTALLWHWAFLEYENNALFARCIKHSWWKKIIKDAERAVLKPFFEDGARLLQQHAENGLLNALYVPLNK